MAQDGDSGPAALVVAATVARRYYLDGLSKSDIAGELNLSRFKVARLRGPGDVTAVLELFDPSLPRRPGRRRRV